MPRTRGRGSRAESRVANLYRRAGYSVRRNIRSRAGESDIIAKKGSVKLLVEVKSGRQTLTTTHIENLARKARYHRAKPVLRKSKRVKLTQAAWEAARRLGVRVRDY